MVEQHTIISHSSTAQASLNGDIVAYIEAVGASLHPLSFTAWLPHKYSYDSLTTFFSNNAQALPINLLEMETVVSQPTELAISFQSFRWRSASLAIALEVSRTYWPIRFGSDHFVAFQCSFGPAKFVASQAVASKADFWAGLRNSAAPKKQLMNELL